MTFNNISSDNLPNLIYLTLLLIVLITGIIANKDISINKSLKYLGAWSLIALVFIALYSYRYEFSDFKDRIMGEINPTSARVEDSGQMIINITQGGHFYLNVEVNNQPMRFMIDTGASDIAIDINSAHKLGINIDNLLFNKAYQTANGISWGAKARVKKLKVGNIVFQNVPVSVTKSDLGTPLLGMTFLRQFRKYEFYRDRLILTP